MFRHCTFEDGVLALRRIAGLSLDVVEASGGRFEIFDCAIRGLSVTRPIEEAVESPSAPVELVIESSRVAQLWVGAGVVGAGSVNGSLVLQAANTSDRFALTMTKVGHAGLLNVDVVTGDELEGIGPDQFDPDEAKQLRRMDYRSVPGRAELDVAFEGI
jgi:hypothetical protein